MPETATSPDGTMIAFERTGEGPVVVLVGGAFSTRSSGAAFAPALADRMTVVSYDRRGRGDSTDASAQPGPGGFAVADTSDRRAAVAREVADLQSVIDAVGGQAMLYGHSSGAALALETAAVTPGVRRVAAYEPPYTGNGAESGPDVGAPVREALAAGDRDTAARRFLAGIGADPDGMASQPWWPGMVAIAHTLPYDFALTDDGPSEAFADITARVLLLAGGDSDEWARQAVRDAARHIPEVATRTLAGQTHNAQDAVLAPVLLEFFLGA